jgi:oligoendopeptidase F
VNEALLFNYLMDTNDDPKLKAYLLNQKCDGFKGTVYRQTMFAEFEKLIHEKVEKGIPLTPDELCSSYFELNKRYYGDAVKPNQLIEMEWARIPHFYYNFYVYKYATGFSAAEAFVQRILTGNSDAMAQYIGFLKAGSSKDPLDILADAGVDLRSPTVIQNGLKGFGTYINQLEDLLAQ